LIASAVLLGPTWQLGLITGLTPQNNRPNLESMPLW